MLGCFHRWKRKRNLFRALSRAVQTSPFRQRFFGTAGETGQAKPTWCSSCLLSPWTCVSMSVDQGAAWRPTQLMRLRLGPMALRQKLDLDFCLGTAAVSLFQHNCTPTAKWSLCALPVSSSCKTLECVQHDSHTYRMATKSMRWPWWPSGDIQVAVGPWWIMLVLGRHNCCVWWWSQNKPVLAEQVFSISKTTGSHLGPLLALASMSTNRGIFWQYRCVISCVSVRQRFLSSKGLPLCGACIAKTWHCKAGCAMWASNLRGSVWNIWTCDFRIKSFFVHKPNGLIYFVPNFNAVLAMVSSSSKSKHVVSSAHASWTSGFL